MTRFTLPLPPGTESFDTWVDQQWAPLRGNPIADRVFLAASEMGDFGMLWMLIAAVPALTGKPKPGRQLYRLAGALAFESLLVNQGLKRVFRRERPSSHHVKSELRQPSTMSFPSGHSTSAVTAAILLSETRVLPRPVLVLLAAIVASSRVHVKMHHPSDVAGGVLIGALFGLLLRRFYRVR